MSAVETSITLQKLEIFCIVAELGSVTKAAERIGIAQPVVTGHLRALEAKLGVRLVGKVGRNISLTEAGERVSRWASEVIASTRQMERDIAGLAEGSAGSVSIAASMTLGSYVLPGILMHFHSEHPETAISTLVSNTRAATEAVRTGECDFGLTSFNPREESKEITQEVLWKEPLVLVAAPNSRFAEKSLERGTVSTLPFVTGPKSFVRRLWEDTQLRASGIVRTNVVLELGHPESVKRAVRADVGVSFLLRAAVREDLERGTLCAVDVSDLELSIPVVLIYRADKSFSSLETALINFIRRAEPSPNGSTQEEHASAAEMGGDVASTTSRRRSGTDHSPAAARGRRQRRYRSVAATG